MSNQLKTGGPKVWTLRADTAIVNDLDENQRLRISAKQLQFVEKADFDAVVKDRDDSHRVGLSHEGTISNLKAEVKRLWAEVEELMKADYWQDRHDIAVKECEQLRTEVSNLKTQVSLSDRNYQTLCGSFKDRCEQIQMLEKAILDMQLGIPATLPAHLRPQKEPSAP